MDGEYDESIGTIERLPKDNHIAVASLSTKTAASQAMDLSVLIGRRQISIVELCVPDGSRLRD